MDDEELPASKIVTLYQDEDGHIQILADDDVSKFEVLGMLQVAYARQYADVHDEEIEEAAWAEEEDDG